ncbi:MAG: AAA family ATPase [Deltaproteobacteria bacterium]|jgi:DNA helicase-2/ATP-dependent DNA helicase PcrA|nr:AAA family ATPase [Deltaproteobacteria bacterium]
MAAQAVKTEAELVVDEVLEHIHAGHNFLLSGGAGSGKTYALVKVLEKIIEENPHTGIACITYTNTAVDQIMERISHDNLRVSTIHDFLWDNIQQFQNELQAILLERIRDDEDKNFILPDDVVVTDDLFSSLKYGIQYKEVLRLQEGAISHDEVILLANLMFEKYSKLCDIIKDKYRFILVDEYQDTQVEVINIILRHISQSAKQNTIGFFGDAMQAIYEKRIGDLDEYLRVGAVHEVKLEQNRRNPQAVIDLANKLRIDNIIQHPSGQMDAPNMDAKTGVVKPGGVTFLYSSSPNLDPVRDFLRWDFSDPLKTKELNLTHNLIAEKANFPTLMEIYDKDKVLDYRKRVKDFLRDNNIDSDSYTGKTFGEVLDDLYAKFPKNKKLLPTPGMQEYIDGHLDLFEAAKGYDFLAFLKFYVDKDHLLDDKKQTPEVEAKKGSSRDALIKHLFKIQNIISLYENRKFSQFLKITDFKISRASDKKLLHDQVQQILNPESGKTIGEVIDLAHDLGLCLKGDVLRRFADRSKYIYDRVSEAPYAEFLSLYHYLEGQTPFSTQHKTKGDEFDNVLVVMDNGKWSQYNFDKLFNEIGNPGSSPVSDAGILERTRKIFYVCCTRSRENLAIFFNSPSPSVLVGAKKLFRSDSIFNLDTIK